MVYQYFYTSTKKKSFWEKHKPQKYSLSTLLGNLAMAMMQLHQEVGKLFLEKYENS